jgi:hypothetical protein
MTPEQLAEIEARANAATEGPWEVDRNYPFTSDLVGIFASDIKQYVVKVADQDWEDNPTSADDATFIANARTDVPALLALVREQQAKLDAVRDTHKPFTHHFQSPPAGSIEVCHSCRESYPCPTIAALTGTDQP